MAKDHFIIEDERMVEEDDGECNQYKINKKPISSSHYDIWLSSTVESETLDYVDVCQLLYDAGPKDSVTLHLANRGGSVDTGIMLVNAVQNCRPGVDIIVESRCFSMAALLALSGKSLTLRPGSWLMFHNYSGGEFGKGREMLDAIQHTHDHLHNWISDLCSPFLTKTELNRLKKDEDVYVRYGDKTLKSRLRRHFDAKNKA